MLPDCDVTYAVCLRVENVSAASKQTTEQSQNGVIAGAALKDELQDVKPEIPKKKRPEAVLTIFI